jgi:hypothetical protein
MKRAIISLLAAVVAFVPLAVAQSEEERFDEDAYENEFPERMVSPLYIDWPTQGVVAKSGEEKIIFRAPIGATVELLGADGTKLAGAVGLGKTPVSITLPTSLEAGEVHVLTLRMTTGDDSEDVFERTLPPILITEDGKIGLKQVAGIGSAIDASKLWDFNGDGMYDLAEDMRALLLRLPASDSLTLPTYANVLESLKVVSGLSEYTATISGPVATVTVPHGTVLGSLLLVGDVSDGSALVVSEDPDYTEPVVLRVRSPLGAERLYWLNVEVAPAPLDLANWTEATGLWHIYDGSPSIRNEAVGKFVSLPAGDDSDGYLPVSPFSGKSLWYGNEATVTGSVYEVGNYLNELSEYGSSMDGGRSESAHSGTIMSPVVTVTADVYDPTLSFWYWYEIESNSPINYDEMRVTVEAVSGATPDVSVKLNPTTYSSSSSHRPHTSAGYNLAAVWKRHEIDLSAFVGQQVRIELFFGTDDEQYNGFRGWFVDQFHLGSNHVPSIGKPVITGTYTAGSTLTANYAGYSDGDGDPAQTAKYAWWGSDDGGVSWKPLSGNGSSLTLQPEHMGMQIKVDVYPYDGKQYGDAKTSDPFPGLA